MPLVVEDRVAAKGGAGIVGGVTTQNLPLAAAPGHNIFEQKVAEGERVIESDYVEVKQPLATEVSSTVVVDDTAAAPPLPLQPDDLVTSDKEEPPSTKYKAPDTPVNLVPDVELHSDPTSAVQLPDIPAVTSNSVHDDLQRVQNQLFED